MIFLISEDDNLSGLATSSKETREGEGIRITIRKKSHIDQNAEVGIGTLIIFIAMLLVAGVTSSVLIQVMDSMQKQALKTGADTLREVSTGIEVTHVSGHISDSEIDLLAIFVSLTAASDSIDLTYTYISLSDSNKTVILNYTQACFSSTVSSGLFSTIDDTDLSAGTYGILVIRDVDDSCTQTSPIINARDLVVLIVNTTDCFSGISTNVDVSGNVIPEFGMSGVIGFTTPSAYVDTIVDLQP